MVKYHCKSSPGAWHSWFRTCLMRWYGSFLGSFFYKRNSIWRITRCSQSTWSFLLCSESNRRNLDFDSLSTQCNSGKWQSEKSSKNPMFFLQLQFPKHLHWNEYCLERQHPLSWGWGLRLWVLLRGYEDVSIVWLALTLYVFVGRPIPTTVDDSLFEAHRMTNDTALNIQVDLSNISCVSTTLLDVSLVYK